jgi:hypothetical protein
MLEQKDFQLSQFQSNDSYGNSQPVNYAIWEPNRYLIIEMPLKFFKTSNPSGGYYNKLSFHLQKNWTTIPTCSITWLNSTPPYYQPSVFVIEQGNNSLRCHDSIYME